MARAMRRTTTLLSPGRTTKTGSLPAWGVGGVHGGVAAAVGDRRAHRLQRHLPLETLCGQAFGAGQVAMLGIYMQRSWIILAASAVLLSPVATLHFRGAHPAAAGTGGEHRRRRQGIHAADHPADVRARHQLPHAEVPPGAEQGDGAGLDRLRGAPHPRRPPRALRLRALLGHRRCRRGVRRLLLAHRAGAGALRRRLVPRWPDGAVTRVVQRALGLHQALPRLRRHALPRDMHEHIWMGGDAVHRAERGAQRAGVE